MSQPHSRKISLDVAKAIAIIAVVYGHVWRALVRSAFFTPDHPLQFLDYAIYAWHMPLFFALAGYNAAGSLKRLGSKAFTLRRLRIILPAYFLWSILQGLLEIFRDHGTLAATTGLHRQTDFTDILTIVYKPIDQFWFLYALMIYHLAAALLYRRPAVLILLSVITFLLNTHGNTDFREELLYHGLFYVGGFLAAGKFVPKFNRAATISVGSFCVFIYVGFLAFGWMIHIDTNNPAMLPASCAAICLVLLLSEYLANSRLKGAMAYIGMASLAIYILHVMFAAAWRTVLMKAGVGNSFIYLISGTLIGVAGPLIVYTFLKRRRMLPYLFLGQEPIPAPSPPARARKAR